MYSIHNPLGAVFPIIPIVISGDYSNATEFDLKQCLIRQDRKRRYTSYAQFTKLPLLNDL